MATTEEATHMVEKKIWKRKNLFRVVFKEFKNNKGEGFTNLKIESSGVDYSYFMFSYIWGALGILTLKDLIEIQK